MVPPGRFQATCVSGAPLGPDRVLQGQQKQNQAQEKSPDRATANTSAMALGTKPVLLYHIYIFIKGCTHVCHIAIYQKHLWGNALGQKNSLPRITTFGRTSSTKGGLSTTHWSPNANANTTHASVAVNCTLHLRNATHISDGHKAHPPAPPPPAPRCSPRPEGHSGASSVRCVARP